MDNADIAGSLVSYADLLEVQGANPFRLRAYRSAARTIKKLSDPIADLPAIETDLVSVAGIGKDLARKIAEIVHEGTFAELEEVRSALPSVVPEALRIPGIGPKKVAALVDELDLRTVDDLRVAAESGRIATVAGFGAKSAETVLKGLAQLEAIGRSVLLRDAVKRSQPIVDHLRSSEGVVRCEFAGAVRRRVETVDEIVILASGESDAVVRAIGRCDTIEEFETNEDRITCEVAALPPLTIVTVAEKRFELAWLLETGSDGHVTTLEAAAKAAGASLRRQTAATSESEIYAAVGLAFRPPEVREARFNPTETPVDLVALESIRGDLHMHTTATDGRDTIAAMAAAASEKGYGYIAITDHSKRVSMANGLDAPRLRRHWDEIRSADTAIDVWCGIECDILEDATLDLPDDVLAEADVVVAVLHYGLRQSEEQIMKRLLHAARHPHVDIIGHPSGRILLKRPGAKIVWPDLYAACADHGTLLEINAAPPRLDLSDTHAREAAEHGIPIVISTDAHSTGGLDQMKWGVYQARRAGLTNVQVANTRDAAGFRSLLK